MYKIHFYSRILIAIVAALLVSEVLVKEVFLGYSPRVRPNIADVLVDKTLALINIDNWRSRDSSGSIATSPSLPGTLTSTFIEGVYAREIDNVVYTEVHMDEVDWVEQTYSLPDGRTVTLKIPKELK